MFTRKSQKHQPCWIYYIDIIKINKNIKNSVQYLEADVGRVVKTAIFSHAPSAVKGSRDSKAVLISLITGSLAGERGCVALQGTR